MAAASTGVTVQQRDGSVPCWLQLWVLHGCGQVVAVHFATCFEPSEGRGPGGSGSPSWGQRGWKAQVCWSANAGHTWTASLPPLSIALSLALTTDDFFLAVPIMTGEHPKETRSHEGLAATFGSLPGAINLLEKGGNSPCSSRQHACQQQCAALQSHPRWL